MKARFWIIGLIVFVILPSIVLAVWRPFAAKPKYETYSVTQGEVDSTISVAGSVINSQSLELSFLSPGIVRTVAVKVGATVKKGDLLVALNTDVLGRQAAQARASVASAQAMLDKAQNRLRSTDLNVLDRSLDSVRIALDSARSQLQDAYRSRDLDANNARVALDNAQRAYQNALNSYNAGQGAIGQSANIARVAMINAQAALTSAQNSYSQILTAYNGGYATMAAVQQAAAALTSASSAYSSAQAQYQAALRQSTAEQANARAQLDSAQSALNSAQSAYNSATSGLDMKITSAQNAVTSAEAAYRLAEAQRSQSIAPAPEADIRSAQAQVAASQAALGMVQAQISQMILRAPIDGKVAQVNVKVAELSKMSQPAIVIETAGEFKIEANISETEVGRIRIGQPVKITIDALPNVNATGTVATIDPAANVVMGVVNYKTTVLFNEPIAELRSSMTADMEIMTEQRPNVVVVPRRALTKADGKYTVKVLENEKSVERSVEVGLVGDVNAEIISGLNVGELVVIKQLSS